MHVWRIVAFGLLGPTLGLLMGLATALALGIPPFEGEVLFVILAYAYAAGVVPAALTGFLDGWLASRAGALKRVFLTALGGYFISALVGLAFLQRRMSIEAILVFALYGMVAAAICSALAGPTFGGRSASVDTSD